MKYGTEEYHVSEENIEEMYMGKHKWSNEDQNWLQPNNYPSVTHQVNIESVNRMVMSNTKRDVQEKTEMETTDGHRE